MFLTSVLCAQENNLSYKIFTGNGKVITQDSAWAYAGKANVIFFGEQHDNETAHSLELQLLKSLHENVKNKDSLCLGMEMFESDNQLIIDEYQHGIISERSFESECRLWPNYQSDYKPLVDYCIQDQIHLSSTNIPRRYASAVFHKGVTILDSLSSEALSYMAPLPLIVDTTEILYQEIMALMNVTGNDNFIYAQAIKDATMAWFISKELKHFSTLLHLNGALHTAYFGGIITYLRKLRPDLQIVSVQCVSQKKIKKLKKENKGKGDIIICIETDESQ